MLPNVILFEGIIFPSILTSINKNACRYNVLKGIVLNWLVFTGLYASNCHWDIGIGL